MPFSLKISSLFGNKSILLHFLLNRILSLSPIPFLAPVFSPDFVDIFIAFDGRIHINSILIKVLPCTNSQIRINFIPIKVLPRTNSRKLLWASAPFTSCHHFTPFWCLKLVVQSRAVFYYKQIHILQTIPI